MTKSETDIDYSVPVSTYFLARQTKMHSNLDVHRCRAIKNWKIAGILAVAFNPIDTLVAVAKENGHIDVLHFPSLSHSLVHSFPSPTQNYKTIVVNNADSRVEPKKKQKTTGNNFFHIRSIVWRDEQTFLTGGLDGVVRFWHATSGKMLDSFPSGGPIWNMALHPGVPFLLLLSSGLPVLEMITFFPHFSPVKFA